MEYASNGKGNLGVTLGAVGTGLGLLDGGANLVGKMLGANGTGSPEARPVTRYEMGLIRESIDQQLFRQASTISQGYLFLTRTLLLVGVMLMYSPHLRCRHILTVGLFHSLLHLGLR